MEIHKMKHVVLKQRSKYAFCSSFVINPCVYFTFKIVSAVIIRPIDSTALNTMCILNFTFYYLCIYFIFIPIRIRSYLQLSYNLSYYHINMKNSAWTKGPLNHIVCQPPHDRPIFCLAVSDNNFVTGSADHGLRQYNIESGKHVRQLFGKKYGHKEWVSTCAYTPSGCVISGGMDSLVCYWDSKGVKCDHFSGHGGSISKVMGNDRIGISSSYDATMIIWDLGKRSEARKLLGPHKQAVMTFDWHQSLLVSGDKSGVVGIWDLNQGQLVRALKTHKGSVAKINIDGKQGMIYSIGLNDGSVAAIDMRTNQGAFKQMVHKGAGNDLKIVDNKVITCSADHTINVLDVPSFKTLTNFSIKDMAFAIQCAYGVVVAATSGGNIVASDLNTGEILYGYGVMKKGQCRLLGLSKDKKRLVCAGQDDSPSLLCF